MDSQALHPIATAHIPGYMPGPDGSDPLFIGVAIVTIGLIVFIGAMYFTLHSLPERMAHHGNHTQFQVIGILALIALFTHNNIFWVAALLIAAFRMPDFLTPLQSMASSLSGILNRIPGGAAAAPEQAEPQPEAEEGQRDV